MTASALLILGIGTVALKYVEQAILPYGLEPIVLGNPDNLPDEAWDHFSKDRFHAVELEARALQRYLAAHPGLCRRVYAVTTLFDELLPLVEVIAFEHGWAYPGAAVVRLSDKATVATYAHALSPPSHAFKAAEPDLLAPLLHAPASDWIIKPACCSGGQAVGTLNGGPGALDALRRHLALHAELQAERWLLQPRLEGTLISFEGYMDAGELHPMGISRRTRIGLTEVANRFPVDENVSPDQYTAGWAGLDALFARAGYRDGWFHCECILGPAGLHLIDANVGRIGGATILEQVALAYGLCPAHLLAHVLLLPLPGYQPRLAQGRSPPSRTLGVWYGLSHAAVLVGLDLAAHHARHTRFAPDGASVPALGTSDYAWVGMFSGPEPAVLDALHCLRLITDAGPAAPAYRLD